MTKRTLISTLPRVACATALAFGLLIPITGCGGGQKLINSGSNEPSRKIGTMTFTVTWPKPSRLIPLAANSVTVTITRGATTVFTQTVVKPANFTDTTPPSRVTATNLEVGDSATPATYTVVASAYPTATGTGTAQATGTVSVGLTLDAPDKVVGLTMNSTITRVDVTPTTGPNLGPGRTRTLTATAYDASNNVVLTAPGKITWRTTNAAAGTLSATTGNPVVFTGATVSSASGVSTQVYAKETESGIESATPATINTVAVGLADSVWAKFHGDTANTGRAKSGAAITSTPSTVSGWPAAGGSVIFSSPIVGTDGTVYIGAYDKNLYAFNPGGSLKWKFTVDGEIEGTPLLTKDGTLYVGTLTGSMYAIRDTGAAGSQVWKFATDGAVFGSATLDKNGYLYFGTTGAGKSIYKLDALSGAKIWQFASSGGVQAAPALNAGETALYAATIDGKAYSVNTSTGVANWTSTPAPAGFDAIDYSSGVVISQVSGADVLLYGTIDGRFYALNASTGAKLWDFDAEAQVYSTPTVSTDGSVVYFATFDNVSGLDTSRVVALNVASGALVWKSGVFTSGFTSSAALSSDGSTLYLGNYDGKIYGLNAATGVNRWSIAPSSSSEYFDSSPAVGADGTIYIGGFSGSVYALK